MSPGEFCLVELLEHKGLDSALKFREDVGGKQGSGVALCKRSKPRRSGVRAARRTGREPRPVGGHWAPGGADAPYVREGGEKLSGRAGRGEGLAPRGGRGLGSRCSPLGTADGEREELAPSPRECKVRARQDLLPFHLPPTMCLFSCL